MSRARHPGSRSNRAFSLIELVIVVVIIGVVASIAVPRLSSTTVRARAAALRADLDTLNRAADFYTAEHAGRCPAHDASGVVSADAARFVQRLLDFSDERGEPGGPFGPYLAGLPPNPFNRLATVRIDGAAPGQGTHGWRYDSARREFRADDSAVTASVRADSTEAAALSALATGTIIDAAEIEALGAD